MLKVDDLNLAQFYQKLTRENQDLLKERIVSTPTAAIGTLRHELIETIGIERTKGFLLRYGWHSGVHDAKLMKEQTFDNKREMLFAGPQMHILHGYLGEVENLTVEVDFDQGTLCHEAIWKDSYEAEEHLKRYGYSNKPVCHHATGYASGYLSTVLGKKVITKETKCKAMGHEHCQAVCRTIEEWDGEVDKELKYYEEDSIIDELNETFKKLKIERDNLSKASDVHQKLVKILLGQNDLSSIANTLTQHTKLPVLIENENLDHIALSGIQQEEGIHYSEQLSKAIERKENKDVKKINQTILLDFVDHKRLITPIYLQKKIVAFCSFIYIDTIPQEVEKLILEQSSLVCSLYLLNDLTRIQTEQRMQGNLLDDLLTHQISHEELSKKAYYIGFQLKDPYFMIAIRVNSQDSTMKEELEYNDQFVNELSIFLKDRNINALVGQKSGKIIVLLSEEKLLKSEVNKKKICQTLSDYFSRKYPFHRFSFGISSSSPSLDEVIQLYDESSSALQAANHYQKIVCYDHLGLEGILLQMNNDNLQKFIQKKLGRVIEEDKNKDMELTKTLYYYLSHNCNINKTARAMNFSVTGIRYRVHKINELLDADINQPDVGYQIYVFLKLLIHWGKLDIDLNANIDPYID